MSDAALPSLDYREQIARIAIARAGVSVQGQLPHWTACQNDPGKSVFWRMAIEETGIPLPVAFRIVEDLKRARRGM